MLFAEIADVSARISATSKRGEKTQALADVIARLEPDEIEPAVAYLSGSLRQGRIGTGWRTVAAVDVVPAAEPTLTVGDVDGAVEALGELTGPGSVAARTELLSGLLGRATVSEAEMIRGLLSGGIRQGALAGVVSAAIAKAAGVRAAGVRRASMLLGDLGAAAVLALTGGEPALRAVRLDVGVAVEPMLATTADDVAGALEELGTASVEWKLDGARIQVHRRSEDVRIFTRNLNDVTDRLPDVVELVRSLPVHDVVLDGETLALDENARPRAFQDTMSRFGRDDDRRSHTVLRAWFFDVLHIDGVQLIDEPLHVRLTHLERIAGAHRIPARLTDDPDEAEAVLAQALDAGHEGVMLKAAESTYDAGRRGKAWRKIKPVHTLDLVVLGAEWGHGRRTGWLSNLHLGARDPGSGDFVMVGKTFKGLTDELLGWQTEQLLDREIERHGIAVMVRPELVVEIAVDGVQSSTRYPGGVALRFARVRRYREDKDPSGADTIHTVRAMLGRSP